MTRALLEQALEALDNSVDLVYEEYTEAVRRYANMPTRKAKLEGLAALAKEHDAARYAIRAELAKPEQPERKPMTDERKKALVSDWFAEDWAQEKALKMLADYDAFNGIKETP